MDQRVKAKILVSGVIITAVMLMSGCSTKIEVPAYKVEGLKSRLEIFQRENFRGVGRVELTIWLFDYTRSTGQLTNKLYNRILVASNGELIAITKEVLKK